METDRHYFIEGLFIIGFSIAAAFFFVWLQSSGHRDDVLYRIHFSESVSGLALGDPVKFHGVDVGTVKAMALDAADPRKVQVDVKLRKEAPVKTDTKASLKLKGITGVVLIELNGGAPSAQRLAAVTPEGQIPEIASEKSGLTSVLDQLPKVIEKFSAIEDQTKKVVTDVGEVTGKIKDNPLLRLGAPKEKAAPAPAETTVPAQKEKASRNR
jgi:phospholipid/cholesterol/gamma-HCH transport system substrate-binding protein